MAILFAKAMGAEVTAISRTDAKRKDAFKLGATDYFATGNNLQEAVKAHSRSLDFILCTISKSSSMVFHSSLYVDFVLSDPENFPIADYLPLLTPAGIFCIVGVIPTPLQVPAFPLIMHSACIAGSNIGSAKRLLKCSSSLLSTTSSLGSKSGTSTILTKRCLLSRKVILDIGSSWLTSIMASNFKGVAIIFCS